MIKKRRDPVEHAAMPGLKDDLQEGRITRRDFLRYATLFGVSTTAAYKLANTVNNGESLLIPSAQAANMQRSMGRERVMETNRIASGASTW